MLSESAAKLNLSKKIFGILIKLRVFPNIYLTGRPFKIFEFKELMHIKLTKADFVLDLGCGYGIQTFCIGKRCKKVLGIDTDKARIEYATHLASQLSDRISCEFMNCSLEDANFPDEHFNYVLSICVIEHIRNYEEVIREVFRILKAGGTFAFSVDALSSITSSEVLAKHKKDFFVEKYFSSNELFQILSKTGFKNIEVYPILKSDFASRLFAKGMKDAFKAKATFLIDYLRLSFHEKKTKNREGLFIVAKCTK